MRETQDRRVAVGSQLITDDGVADERLLPLVLEDAWRVPNQDPPRDQTHLARRGGTLGCQVDRAPLARVDLGRAEPDRAPIGLGDRGPDHVDRMRDPALEHNGCAVAIDHNPSQR